MNISIKLINEILTLQTKILCEELQIREKYLHIFLSNEPTLFNLLDNKIQITNTDELYLRTKIAELEEVLEMYRKCNKRLSEQISKELIEYINAMEENQSILKGYSLQFLKFIKSIAIQAGSYELAAKIRDAEKFKIEHIQDKQNDIPAILKTKISSPSKIKDSSKK